MRLFFLFISVEREVASNRTKKNLNCRTSRARVCGGLAALACSATRALYLPIMLSRVVDDELCACVGRVHFMPPRKKLAFRRVCARTARIDPRGYMGYRATSMSTDLSKSRVRSDGSLVIGDRPPRRAFTIGVERSFFLYIFSLSPCSTAILRAQECECR